MTKDQVIQRIKNLAAEHGGHVNIRTFLDEGKVTGS